MYKKILGLFMALALILSIAPAASAKPEWMPGRSTSGSERMTVKGGGGAITLYSTVYWRSGSSKPNGKGHSVVRPYKQNYRYNDPGQNQRCSGVIAWMSLSFEYATFQTTFTDGLGNRMALGTRRLSCSEDGTAILHVRYPKRTTPTFHYTRYDVPEYTINTKVAWQNYPDKKGVMKGKMKWLGVGVLKTTTKHTVPIG